MGRPSIVICEFVKTSYEMRGRWKKDIRYRMKIRGAGEGRRVKKEKS